MALPASRWPPLPTSPVSLPAAGPSLLRVPRSAAEPESSHTPASASPGGPCFALVTRMRNRVTAISELASRHARSRHGPHVCGLHARLSLAAAAALARRPARGPAPARHSFKAGPSHAHHQVRGSCSTGLASCLHRPRLLRLVGSDLAPRRLFTSLTWSDGLNIRPRTFSSPRNRIPSAPDGIPSPSDEISYREFHLAPMEFCLASFGIPKARRCETGLVALTEKAFTDQANCPKNGATRAKQGVSSAPEDGPSLPFGCAPRARGLSFWLGGRQAAGRLARGAQLFEFCAAARL